MTRHIGLGRRLVVLAAFVSASALSGSSLYAGYFTSGNDISESAISVEATTVNDRDGTDGPLLVRDTGSGLELPVACGLVGGQRGGRASALREQIVVAQAGTTSLDVHLFQPDEHDVVSSSDSSSGSASDSASDSDSDSDDGSDSEK